MSALMLHMKNSKRFERPGSTFKLGMSPQNFRQNN
jgi:hypothetical protein